jgi:malate dehydrogenase (oxaloacetate-decarboxylating)(NADP+)
LARPILVARPEVLKPRIEKCGLRIKPERDFDLVNPNKDARFRDYWQDYYNIMQRKGVSEEYAKREVSRRTTLMGALMVHHGDADGMICGTIAQFSLHLQYISDVIGLRSGVNRFAAMNMLILPGRTIFICDTYVNAPKRLPRSPCWRLKRCSVLV